jgi:hypothetical protein
MPPTHPTHCSLATHCPRSSPRHLETPAARQLHARPTRPDRDDDEETAHTRGCALYSMIYILMTAI